ncbi:tyrosine-type recombinase/integrase [Aeromonas veronii]
MAQVRTVTGKRGKTYRVQMMRNGQRIDKSFPRKKDAEAFLSRLTVCDDLADAMTSVSLTTIPLSDAIRDYLDQYKGRDRSMIQRLGWWADRIGSKPVGKIQRIQIKTALDALAKDEKSPATINRYKAAISSVFEWFNDKHDTKHNPAREVRQQTESAGRTRFLSDAEIGRLLDAASNSRWERLHLLIHMALATGARRSELINLKWSDIDFQRKTAHLEQTKNGDRRTLTLTTAVIQELMPFRQVGDAYLFPHPGKLYGPFAEFDHHWRGCLIEAGISDFRFHDLRHSSASLMAKSGASLLELAEHLGHKTLNMVKRYSHLAVDHRVEQAERIFGGLAK